MASIAIPIFYSDRMMLVDEADAPLVRNYRVYFDKGKRSRYAIGTLPGVTGCRKMHRIILGLSSRDGKLVDHINGNRLDNRRENMRFVDNQTNRINAYKLNCNNKVSGVMGVSLKNRPTAKKRWVAHICVDGKKMHLGYFSSIAEAAACRAEAEIKHFGQRCPVSINPS